ncbi:UDP-2,3-diacylglucosamine diphosphatase [Rubrivivax sp. RP6-9]|uniref:UDP-2,3-diacylglucosamine diphosphatase n=1 Tax=Rubrivivax sp. RP6-9 TaxID=3415750 RepID=UPI003CC5F010
MQPGSDTSAVALPVFYELAAPKGWRSIDFISDMHLSAALPHTVEAWAQHLRNTPADAVFMLGDVFEVWVGDDARQLPFERHCVDVMAEAASRRTLAVMVGNRDFLLGAQMLRACGAMALPDPTLLTAWGRPVLLTHGDALCLEDTAYQSFRREVRSDHWQQDFLARPLAERLAIAADIRRQSQQRHSFDGRVDADIDAGTAVAWLHALGASEMVHGHTHRPGSQDLAPGFKRHVLSDWDLDDAERPRAQVLRLSRDGFVRLQPTGATGPA